MDWWGCRGCRGPEPDADCGFGADDRLCRAGSVFASDDVAFRIADFDCGGGDDDDLAAAPFDDAWQRAIGILADVLE